MSRSVLFVGALVAIITISSHAGAACYGGSAFQSCYDESGNSYTVNRFGNTTMMQGSNPRTGSQWNETVQHFGNTTTYNGMTNGRPWNMQQNSFGGVTTYNGMNSRGRSFSYTCTQFGCQ